MVFRFAHVLTTTLLATTLAPIPNGPARAATPPPTTTTYASLPPAQQRLVDDLERRTFDWFWDSADPKTGLVPDHYPGESFSSIAAVGFGLTAYGGI